MERVSKKYVEECAAMVNHSFIEGTLEGKKVSFPYGIEFHRTRFGTSRQTIWCCTYLDEDGCVVGVSQVVFDNELKWGPYRPWHKVRSDTTEETPVPAPPELPEHCKYAIKQVIPGMYFKVEKSAWPRPERERKCLHNRKERKQLREERNKLIVKNKNRAKAYLRSTLQVWPRCELANDTLTLCVNHDTGVCAWFCSYCAEKVKDA